MSGVVPRPGGGERPLRLVALGPSLIADIGNPGATSARALLGALAADGHDVAHLERRGNPLLLNQLRLRGSSALRALNARYPDVRVRQYDLPRGKQERAVWLGTELSTADAVLALPGTPDEELELVALFETPHLARLVSAGAVGDVVWPADGPPVAVQAQPGDADATGTLAVAYDNIASTPDDGLPDGCDRVVVGSSHLPGWRYLPEVEVAELYRTVRDVIVVDAEVRAEAVARRLLPAAAGCEVTHRRSLGEPASPVAPDVSELSGVVAGDVAAGLVATVRGSLREKRRTLSG